MWYCQDRFSNWEVKMDQPLILTSAGVCSQKILPLIVILIVNCGPPFLRQCVHGTGLRVGCGTNESASTWSVSAHVSAGNLHVCSRD